MTKAQNETTQKWEELPCGCIVYRAILRAPFIEKVSGKILRGAFLRRSPGPDGKPRDKKGLSVTVYLNERQSNEQIADHINSYVKCHGIGSLHVGKVRDVETEPNLNVERDEEHHANITGLPAHGENDAKAERLATVLADQARLIWRKT